MSGDALRLASLRGFSLKMACHEREPFDSRLACLRQSNRSLRAFDRSRMARHERRPFDSLRSLRAFSLEMACHERTFGLRLRKLKVSRMVRPA